MAKLSGMTGFGRADGQLGSERWSWEVRSVNGKGLESRLRLPPGFDRLDIKCRERVKARFKRGNFQASLTLKHEAAAGEVRVDLVRIESLLAATSSLVEKGLADKPRLDGLLALKGVLDSEDTGAEILDTAKLDAALIAGLDEALDALASARLEEGAAMGAILAEHVATIERLTQEAAACSAVRIEAIRDRIAAKYAELLTQDLDEERLVTEAAAMAVKLDVREEIDRLGALIVSARELLAGGSPAGRKLDFLSQEFNREANTLCSKSSDSSLTQIGLELKNTIDQFREQLQNVE